MVLAETFHHSSAPFPPKFKEELVERHEQHEAPRGQETARTRVATHCTSTTGVAGDAVFFELYDEDTAGWRPPPLDEARPQGQLERHAGIGYELVLALDAPVLQVVEVADDINDRATLQLNRALAGSSSRF